MIGADDVDVESTLKGVEVIIIIFTSSNSSCKKVKIEITIGEQDNYKAELNSTKRCPFKINNRPI